MIFLTVSLVLITRLPNVTSLTIHYSHHRSTTQNVSGSVTINGTIVTSFPHSAQVDTGDGSPMKPGCSGINTPCGSYSLLYSACRRLRLLSRDFTVARRTATMVSHFIKQISWNISGVSPASGDTATVLYLFLDTISAAAFCSLTHEKVKGQLINYPVCVPPVSCTSHAELPVVPTLK